MIKNLQFPTKSRGKYVFEEKNTLSLEVSLSQGLGAKCLSGVVLDNQDRALRSAVNIMIAVLLPAEGIEPTSRYQRTFLRRKPYTTRLLKYLSKFDSLRR